MLNDQNKEDENSSEFTIPTGITNLNSIPLKDLDTIESNSQTALSECKPEKKINMSQIEKQILSDLKFSRVLDIFPKDIDFEAIAFVDNEMYQELIAKIDAVVDPNELIKLLEERKGYKLKLLGMYIILLEQLRLSFKEAESGYFVRNYKIYVFDGKVYVEVKKSVFKTFLTLIAQKAGIDKLTIKTTKNSNDLYEQMVELEEYNYQESKNDEVKFALENGTLVINKNEKVDFKGFDPEDFLTIKFNIEYNPTATCPAFDKFLNQVLPDPDSQLLFYEALAYSILPQWFMKLEKILVLFGRPHSGKSTVYEALRRIFNDSNISTYSLKKITTDPNVVSQFEDKLINVSTEKGGMNVDSENLKVLGSGEPILSKQLYHNVYSVSQYPKLIILCNELPKDFQGETASIARRFLILGFNVVISEEEKDINLPDKLALEASGIFNNILLGLDRIIKNKRFTNSKIADESLNEYRKSLNSVELFLEEKGLVKSTKEHCLLTDLYKSYRHYCEENGFEKLNNPNFNARLRALGFEFKRATHGYTAVYAEYSRSNDEIERMGKIGDFFKLNVDLN